MIPRPARALGLSLACLGCTMIGIDNPRARRAVDYGSEMRVPICLVRDTNVSSAHAHRLLEDWNRRDGRHYGLYFEVQSEGVSPRTAWTTAGMLADGRRGAPEECERLIYFGGWKLVDTGYGLVALGLGLVGIPTGYVFGVTSSDRNTVAVQSHLATLDDLVYELFAKLLRPRELLNPRLDTKRKDVTVHELYHLVGCGHGLIKGSACYRAIQSFKLSAE
jgi:hypothetical protein